MVSNSCPTPLSLSLCSLPPLCWSRCRGMLGPAKSTGWSSEKILSVKSLRDKRQHHIEFGPKIDNWVTYVQSCRIQEGCKVITIDFRKRKFETPKPEVGEIATNWERCCRLKSLKSRWTTVGSWIRDPSVDCNNSGKLFQVNPDDDSLIPCKYENIQLVKNGGVSADSVIKPRHVAYNVWILQKQIVEAFQCADLERRQTEMLNIWVQLVCKYFVYFFFLIFYLYLMHYIIVLT